MSNYYEYKKLVFDTTMRLAEKGVLVGSGGNVSVRVDGEEDLIAITPSSRDYSILSVDDICITNFERELLEGEYRPSVETGMHISVYRTRQDIGAVVHTHQIYASVFALTGESIPAIFDEQVANLGNRVDVVPYGLSGSQDLLNNITEAVSSSCNAYVLQNHGALLLGMDMDAAVRNVFLLEKCAMVYYLALASGKQVSTLAPEIESTIFDMMKSEQRKEIRRRKKAKKAVPEE